VSFDDRFIGSSFKERLHDVLDKVDIATLEPDGSFPEEPAVYLRAQLEVSRVKFVRVEHVCGVLKNGIGFGDCAAIVYGAGDSILCFSVDSLYLFGEPRIAFRTRKLVIPSVARDLGSGKMCQTEGIFHIRAIRVDFEIRRRLVLAREVVDVVEFVLCA